MTWWKCIGQEEGTEFFTRCKRHAIPPPYDAASLLSTRTPLVCDKILYILSATHISALGFRSGYCIVVRLRLRGIYTRLFERQASQCTWQTNTTRLALS